MSSTATLRQALAQLQAYTSHNLQNQSQETKSIDIEKFQKLKNRYLAARKQYLKHRITELVVTQLSEPLVNPKDYEQSLEKDGDLTGTNNNAVLREIQDTVDAIKVRHEVLLGRFHNLVSEGRDLETIVRDLEVKREQAGDVTRKLLTQEDELMGSDNDGENNDPMDENDSCKVDDAVQLQNAEEDIQKLITRKSTQMQQILRLKQQIQSVQSDYDKVTSKLQSICRNENDPDSNDDNNDNVDEQFDLSTVNAATVEKEMDEVKNKILNLNEMTEWYDNVRCALETLSGLSIKNIEFLDGDKNRIEVQVKLRIDDDKENSSYVLGVMLDRLEKSSKDSSQTLRVSNARVVGNNELRSSSSKLTCVALSRGTIDEIVQASRSFALISSKKSQVTGSGDDLKFILRESLAKLRGGKLRLKQLDTLRTKYLTQIDFTDDNDIDTAICTLDEGITVMLKLTPDCPLLPGSVFIDQIAGLGGWDASVLRGIRDKVNARRCTNAIEAMNAVVKEIKRASIAKPPSTEAADLL